MLTVLDFTTLVNNQITAIQAKCNSIIDFTVGSVMRAFVESNCSVAIWLQNLIVQVMGLSRAATSNGTDLDTWMSDFGLVRIDAIASTGVVTFSRFTSTQQALIPLGSVVQTSDRSVQFLVVLDVNNPNYSASQSGYVIAIGTASIDVPVVCFTPGSIGNVDAGAISSLGQSISGIDLVNNAASFVNGMDTETDDEFRSRFILTLQALRQATNGAVAGAVASVQPGLTYNIVENQNFDGSKNDGYFYVVIDDGTGYPSTSLIDAATVAVENVRALTTSFGVFAPNVKLVDVTLTLVAVSSDLHDATATLAKQWITNYVNGLGMGKSLSYSALSRAIYESDSNISNIVNYVIGNNVSDIIPDPSTVLKAGKIQVN